MAWGKPQANTFCDGMENKPWLYCRQWHGVYYICVRRCTSALVLTILKSKENFYKIKKKVFKIGSPSEKV